MTLDLDELEARIAEGEKKNLFVAPVVKQLISELRELRSMRRADNEEIARAYDFARDKGRALERADVVAHLRWLEEYETDLVYGRAAYDIEHGEHLKENKP